MHSVNQELDIYHYILLIVTVELGVQLRLLIDKSFWSDCSTLGP